MLPTASPVLCSGKAMSAKTVSSSIRLYLLGSFRIESFGGETAQVIRLPRRKVEALLAYLVLHPEAHLREKLAALVWGDFPDAQARAGLAQPSQPKNLQSDCHSTLRP